MQASSTRKRSKNTKGLRNMATFKFTIPDGTPLWGAVGHLPSKARNAEIYRLAATGLLMQNSDNQLKFVEQPKCVEARSEVSKDQIDMNVGDSNFMKIDLGDDLLGMFANQ